MEDLRPHAGTHLDHSSQVRLLSVLWGQDTDQLGSSGSQAPHFGTATQHVKAPSTLGRWIFRSLSRGLPTMGRVGVRQSIVSPASDIEATLSQELTEGSGYTLSSQKGAPGNGVRGSTPSLGITGWLCPDLYTNESPVASHRPSECGRPTSNNGA